MRRWMLWPGALSAVFLLQCGGDSGKSERRAPPRAGSGGVSTAGTGGDGGTAGALAGRGGAGGTSDAGAATGGATQGGSGGSKAGASSVGGSAIAGTGGAGTGGAGGSSGLSGSSGAPSQGGEAGSVTPGDAGVTLNKLSAYQAVEVPLVVGGRVPMRAAPVVLGRRTLIRAFVTPGAAFTPGAVSGTLTIDDGVAPVDLSATIATLDGSSTPSDLDTTLNFDVPAGRITAATTLRLVVNGEDGELLRFPESAPLALEAESANGNLAVTIVPLVVNGYAPDLSEANVRSYTTLLRGMLPVPNVDVTVRLPYTLDYDVNADGWGWDEALDQLYVLRAEDEPPDDTYYYGLLAPGATFDDWCPDGCTVGLSVVASAAEVEYRGSIGVGFFDSPRDTFSPETMVHELGHAMGREHSPCGTDDADPRFPYEDGSIGSWGLHAGALRDPTEDADVMGYCTPVWVSDYTFDRLFTRLAYVNGSVPKLAPAPQARSRREKVRTLTVRADGTLGWGRERPGTLRSSGTPTNVELLDAGGRVLGVVSAPFARFDHLPGGFVTLPASATATPGLASVRALGRTLRLAH